MTAPPAIELLRSVPATFTFILFYSTLAAYQLRHEATFSQLASFGSSLLVPTLLKLMKISMTHELSHLNLLLVVINHQPLLIQNKPSPPPNFHHLKLIRHLHKVNK
ncbi:hypothetical protein FHG87_016458 [Trinorchestia longiramus]|nr:hypothetical protein FHG87_016458 [Trinorchestia longiramus]